MRAFHRFGIPLSTLLGLSVIAIGTVTSCSGEPVRQPRIHSIYLYNLQARRPPGPGADPEADYPDEKESRSFPLPDSKFDCVPFAAIFKQVDLPALRKCLQNPVTEKTETQSKSANKDKSQIVSLSGGAEALY